MLRFNLLCACSLAIAAMLVSDASAQNRGGGNTGGNALSGGLGVGTGQLGIGNTGIGNTGFGTTGMGTTGFGNTNSLSGRTGTNGTGTNSGFGNTSNRTGGTNSLNNAGMNGVGMNSGFGQTGTGMSSQFGQQGTFGDNSQGGMQSQFGQGAGRNATGGNNNQFGNLFQNQFRAQTAFGATGLFGNQQRRTTGGAQPSLRLGFEMPQRPSPLVEQELENRLQAVGSRPALAMESRFDIDGVKLEVENGGVVRLTGEVANDAARRRAGNIIRLEPGVKKVINELTVANAAK